MQCILPTHTLHRPTASQEEMAAVATPAFFEISEWEMRQWVNANPGRVNDVDGEGETPLYVACTWLSIIFKVRRWFVGL